MRELAREFRAFVMRGNVLDLAVAVILGAAFGAVVNAFANGILMNLIAAVFGQPNFDSIGIDAGDGRLEVGRFLTALVNFLIVAFALFLVIRAFAELQRRRRRDEVPEEQPVPSEDVLLLREIRDLLASRPPGA